MKVVFFVGTLQAGGLERFVTRVSLLANEQKSFVPTVICLHEKTGIFVSELESAKIKVYQAPKRWFRSVNQCWKLIKLIRTIKPDIIHSQVNFSILQQFLAVRMAGVQFTMTERNCYTRKGLALMRRRFQYGILKLFNVTYSANSARVAEHLATMLHEKPEMFPVLTNGVSLPEYGIHHDRDGSAGKPVRIAYVARMAEHKGHNFFLQVIKHIRTNKKLFCEAVLIGDGSFRSEIEREVKELNLSPYVTFTGVISNVGEALKDVDMLALLSDYEGMPNVVIEAMAAGKPVVATDVGNVQELLATGAGIVVDKDINEASEAFQKLISNPNERLRRGQEGRTKVVKDYSMTDTVSRLKQYYKTIIDNKT